MLCASPSPSLPLSTPAAVRAGRHCGWGEITAYPVEPSGNRLAHAAYRLRQSVFCREKKWFDLSQPLDGPSGERDRYDASACHVVAVQHLPGGVDTVVATVRLVPYTQAGGLPSGRFNPRLYDELGRRGIGLETTAEVSRLCIDRRFRSHPPVLHALLRELYRVCKQTGIGHLVASMEDALHRLLKAGAIAFEPLDGGYFDYHGEVRTFLLEVGQAEATLKQQYEPLYHYVTAPFIQSGMKGVHHGSRF